MTSAARRLAFLELPVEQRLKHYARIEVAKAVACTAIYFASAAFLFYFATTH